MLFGTHNYSSDTGEYKGLAVHTSITADSKSAGRGEDAAYKNEGIDIDPC